MQAYNILAFIGGVLTHAFYFRHGEHDLLGWRYIQIFVIWHLLATAAFSYSSNIIKTYALSLAFRIASIYLTGLYTSLLVYRILFHPLRKFPGPFASRISALNLSWLVRHGKAYETFQRLHAQYGDFVRIGSSDISVAHPDAVEVLYGVNSVCLKPSGYEVDAPYLSLQSTRDRADHDRRRRVWAPAFSDRSLRGYESRIGTQVDELVHQINQREGKVINVTQWFNFFGFDVMGDLAFNKTFDMLKGGNMHWAINALTEGMAVFSFLPPTWVNRLLLKVPGLAAKYWQFINFSVERLQERVESKPEDPDIMSALLKPFGETKLDRTAVTSLQIDARLIIVAGSDTTSSSLASLFYYLASEPSVMAKLRAELAPIIAANRGGDIKAYDLQNLEYLNGCINEALRLNPPVPSAFARLTPPQGVHIGGTYIPGNTVVACSQYVLGRTESIYPSALSFLPERWSSAGSSLLPAKAKAAFAPFSIGPYSCIGKNLALMEIRLLTARLLEEYDDIEFAPGEDGKKFMEKASEHLTLAAGPLNLVFRKRRDGKSEKHAVDPARSRL